MDAVALWPTEGSRTLYRRFGFDAPAELLELQRATDAREPEGEQGPPGEGR